MRCSEPLVFLAACAAVDPSTEAARGAGSVLAASDPARLMSAVALAVLAGLLVLIVFLVASLAIIRSVRGAREGANRRRAAPTPSDDVWTKHKLPDVWDEDDDDERQPVC